MGGGGGLVLGGGQGGAAGAMGQAGTGGGGGGLVLPKPDAGPPDTAPMTIGPLPTVDAGPTPSAPDAMPPQPPPVACNPSASPSTCASGQWCSKATRTCLTAGTVMRWNFTNMCAEAGDIGVRLQDVTHGGGWPAAGKIYVIEPDTKRFVEISCIEGSKVCFGARSADQKLLWGADTDFSEDCTSCCHTCTAGASPTHDLVCTP